MKDLLMTGIQIFVMLTACGGVMSTPLFESPELISLYEFITYSNSRSWRYFHQQLQYIACHAAFMHTKVGDISYLRETQRKSHYSQSNKCRGLAFMHRSMRVNIQINIWLVALCRNAVFIFISCASGWIPHCYLLHRCFFFF